MFNNLTLSLALAYALANSSFGSTLAFAPNKAFSSPRCNGKPSLFPYYAASSSRSSSITRTALCSTTERNTNNGKYTGKAQEALKKMRGVSVSVGYVPTANDGEDMSSMEMELFSQALRQAKAATIWTSDLNALQGLAKEQEFARGNFPGPVPIIYNGDILNMDKAIEMGANGIVLDLADVIQQQQNNIAADVICRVGSATDVRSALDAGYEYAFVFPGSSVDETEIEEILAEIPKESVVIASLDAMQNDSAEVTRGKELAAMVSEKSGSKVHALLIHDACVGDAEDLKYAAFVVESVSKKSSSQFSMTGLTGSTNGHFGTASDNSFENAKWKRMANKQE